MAGGKAGKGRRALKVTGTAWTLAGQLAGPLCEKGIAVPSEYKKPQWSANWFKVWTGHGWRFHSMRALDVEGRQV